MKGVNAVQRCSIENQIEGRYRCTKSRPISSVESQKGVIADHQKGAIAIDFIQQ